MRKKSHEILKYNSLSDKILIEKYYLITKYLLSLELDEIMY